MGFNVRGATVTLEFAEGTVMHGAHVECSLDLTIREFVDMQRIWARVADGDMDDLLAGFEAFGAVITAWDLEDNGKPVPATATGLTEIPLAMAMAVFRAWSDAVAAKSPNSLAASGNGATSEAA